MSTQHGQLVEIGEHFGEGFRPVLDFAGWRVAMKRWAASAVPANFTQVDRHNETNEVFIPTAGQATLLVMDGGDAPTTPHLFPMQPNVAYNVLAGVWHHVFMASDAHIVVVERTETTRANSNYYALDAATLDAIRGQVTLG